jgi:hypothetical protein
MAWAFGKFIGYTSLSGDGVLMSMISGVHDVVPQQTAMPYVVIGDGRASLQAAESAEITECVLELYIWSDTGGRKTALAIMNRIHALLHLGVLSLTGFELLTMRSEQANTVLSDQGTYLRGSLTLYIAVAEVAA